MRQIPFKTNRVEGLENIMDLTGVNPKEIRFNHKSREIFVCCEDTLKYKLEDIDQMSWQQIKKLVSDNGGTWSSKKAGLDFLVGVKNET